MIFFTSDTHYGHKNVIEFSKRPFNSVEEMHEILISNWNAAVGLKDTIYHLGDVSFGDKTTTSEILSRLNGHKHLILGNHDKQIAKHSHHFESVSSLKEVRIGEQKIVMCHFAMRVWNKSHYGSWMLHGHSHGSLPPMGLSVDVGVDSTWITGKAEYRPFSFQEIQEFMEKRTLVNLDHHKVRD